MFYKFLNRARRCLENKSLLDDGRIDQLEGGMKQMELVANEAERKYEEVGNHGALTMAAIGCCSGQEVGLF